MAGTTQAISLDADQTATPAQPGRSRGVADRLLSWGVVALFMLLVIVLARTAWVCDDAFITLRVVDNFVHGYGPRWNVVERVQAFTHPLWFLLLVPSYVVAIQHGWLTLVALSALASVATVALLAWRVAPHAGAAMVALALLVSSRAFVDYATSGLENALSHLLVLLGTWAATRDDLPESGRLRGVAWCAGLATLNRLDTILLFLPALCWLAWRSGPRSAARQIGAAFLPLAAWLLFAFVYYGSPWPNTALAKLASGVPTSVLMAQGLRYLSDSLHRDPITLVTIAAALASAFGWHRRGPAPFLAAGIVLYVVYVVRAGGDFMSGRFLSVPFCASVALLARTVLPAAGAPALVLMLLALATGLAPDHPNVLSGSSTGVVRNGIMNRDGIADERLHWFPYTGLLNSAEGWTRPLPPMSLGGRSRRGPGHIFAHHFAIGALGYYAGPRLYVVDWVALSDPLLARLPAASNDPIYARQMQRELGVEPSAPLRIGHHLRNQPPGYFRSIIEGRCLIDDPAVNELCQRVWRLTRGPLFSLARLREAMVLLFAGPLPIARTEYRSPPWDEVLRLRPRDPEATLHLCEGLLGVRLGEEAFRLAAAALETTPGDYNLVEIASRALIVARRPVGALAFAGQAITLEPTAAGGYRYRAEALAALGRTDEAIRELRVAATLDPLAAHATYYDMALILSEAGRGAEAMPWFDLAAERGWSFHRQARDAFRRGHIAQ